MPAAQLPNTALWEGWVLGFEPWGDEMNQNLRTLDALVQGRALDKDLTAPPGSPAAGDVYLVGGSATGAWSTHDAEITRYSGTAWEFYVPKEGWSIWIADESLSYVYDSVNWVPEVGATILGLDAKTAPVVGDSLAISDSEDAGVGKNLTIDDLQAMFEAYFNTLYSPLAAPFDAYTYSPGVPGASATLMRIPLVRSVVFPANFSGSYGISEVAATASTVFDVKKNGSSVGSITFAAAATTATFATAGGTPVTFVAGDILSVIAPASPDTTLASVGFGITGVR